MYRSSILRTLASREEIFFEGRHWIHFPRYAYREGYPGPGSRSWTTSECHPGTQPSPSTVGHEDLILKPGAITGLWRETLAAQGTHRPWTKTGRCLCSLPYWMASELRAWWRTIFLRVLQKVGVRGRELWVTEVSLVIVESEVPDVFHDKPLASEGEVEHHMAQVIVLSLNLEACWPKFYRKTSIWLDYVLWGTAKGAR